MGTTSVIAISIVIMLLELIVLWQWKQKNQDKLVKEVNELQKKLETNGLLFKKDLDTANGKIEQLESEKEELAQKEEELLKEAKDRIDKLNEQLLDLVGDKTKFETEKETLEKQIKEFKDWKTDQEKKVLEQFEALSQKTLKTVKEELETKHGQFQKEQQEKMDTNITQLLKPLTEIVKQNDDKVKEFVEKTTKQTTELKTQIELSYKQTQELVTAKDNLVSALKGSKGRGDWGELELIRLLEESGLIKGYHYEFQATQANASRPDIKIKLPNNNVLYIDAKTLLVRLEQMQETLDANDLQEERKKLTQDLKKEITKLHSRDYQSEGCTVDFVILYVPRESMLRIPLEEEPTLIEDAAKNGVILASPLILMAVLKTVAQGWHQAQLAEYTRDIEAMGKELHKRAATFLERYEKVGKKIEELSGQYEETTKSFTGQQGFVRQLKKFEEYGCKSTKSLPSRYQLLESHGEVVSDTIDLEPQNNGSEIESEENDTCQVV